MRTARRWLCVFAGLAVAFAAPALAQPAQDADALAAQLAGLELKTTDAGTTIAERERAHDEAIDVRRRLLELLPASDERREPIALRQGAALIDVLWRDGAAPAVLYGIPVFDQHERVRAAAAEADRVLREFGDQGARIRAAALVLAAAASDDRAERARLAGDALAVADRSRELGLPVAGRFEGTALLLRGGNGDARRALALWESLLHERGAAEAPTPVIAERWFGWVRANAAAAEADAFESALERFARAREQEPFVRGGAPDPLLTILGADVATAALLERWRSSRDAGLLRRAVQEQAALLERGDLGLPAETVRSLVYEKLARVVDGSMPLDGLHPAATLAEAVALTRGPESGAESLELLERLAARPDAGDYAPEALWEMAVVLSPSASPRERVRAVEALTRLAREFPGHARAGRALDAALAYGRSLLETSPEPIRADARAAYLRALELATEPGRAVENADLWKYERARLLLERTPDGETADAALSLLESVDPASEAAAAAGTLYLRTLERTIRTGLEAVRAARARPEGDASRKAAGDLLPLTRRGAAWARRNPGAAADALLFAHAEALTESGSPDAEPIYRDLLRRNAAVEGGDAALRLGLARALLLAGRRAEAFGMLRELATGLEALSPRPAAFWHAWALMLETLAAENADGSRAGAIRTHITRLRTLDTGLGGEPWRSRIRRVGESVGQ